MEEKIFFNSVEEFLKYKGIHILPNLEKNKDFKLFDDTVKRQLALIREIHEILYKYNQVKGLSLSSVVGKDFEERKICVKRFKKDINSLLNQEKLSELDIYMLSTGKKILEKAEKCIATVANFDYMDIIYRSTKAKEICLGYVSFNDLKKQEFLEVRSVEKVAYNIYEEDAVELFKVLVKMGYKGDYKDHINTYCNIYGLGKGSQIYIQAMLSFPDEFIKIWNKYKMKKKDWTMFMAIDRLEETYKKYKLFVID